jgi:hypothetical protein
MSKYRATTALRLWPGPHGNRRQGQPWRSPGLYQRYSGLGMGEHQDQQHKFRQQAG